MTLQNRAGLRHLHQTENSLLHARAAGRGDDHHRQFFRRGPLHHPGDLLADHRTHRSAHEAEIHHAEYVGVPVQPGGTADDRIVERSLFRILRQPHTIRFRIGESERIDRLEIAVHLDEAVWIGERDDPGVRLHRQMAVAVPADQKIVMKPVGVERLAAVPAFDPRTVRDHHFALAAGRHAQRRIFPAAEQRHKMCNSS